MIAMLSSGRLAFYVLVSLLTMHQCVFAQESNVWAVGDAVHLDTAVPLYTETHCADGYGPASDVLYRGMNQVLLAHKVLDYSSGPLTPSFVQQNFYSQEVIAVKLEGDQLNMAVKEAGDADPEKSVVPVSQASIPLVIDAGFDTFVIENWDSLVGGTSKKFQFPFAARKSLLTLRIHAARCSYDSDKDQCFSLKIDNWLISMLVAPIELGYDPTLKRLTRFRGLSNIGDANGQGQSVDIRYRYEDIATSACRWDDKKSPEDILGKQVTALKSRDGSL